MMTHSNIIVLKFGSSVLRSEADFASVVHEIYRHWREGMRVVAVVSALGNTTDRLLQQAKRICTQPETAASATLLATGEAASAALLSLALTRSGIPVRLLDAVQVGLRTTGGHMDATPISIDTARLLEATRCEVVVLPGFVGRGEDGDTTLLGRGGSDYSALYLAQQLRARCVLVKDIDGLYTSDPAKTSIRPLRFIQASYDTALRVGGKVVQQKAVRFAAANKFHFSITSIGSGRVTNIGSVPDQLDGSDYCSSPLRVALLGCGTVGSGVYQRLAALPDLFTVTGVGVRKGARARSTGVPEHLITPNLEALLERPCDVVVELIGGTTRAASLIERVLRLGRDVVSANKALLSFKAEALERLAADCDAELRYSAAVGGSLPAIETIKRARTNGRIIAFSAVLNGTCNFILDRLFAGASVTSAVRGAQDEGYAEADPTLDLSGIDAAQKLILLVRAAFDVNLPLELVALEGIERVDEERLNDARKLGKTLKLVAQCRRSGDDLEASVKPIELPLSHSLALPRGVENRLIVELENGDRLIASGQGAGCWPTTEAVMADLFDIRRHRSVAQLSDLEERVA
jgi:homoserine dehydrogenase